MVEVYDHNNGGLAAWNTRHGMERKQCDMQMTKMGVNSKLISLSKKRVAHPEND
jgi:hypothetical protein